MATVALFHSVLGVRPGVHDAADKMRAHGHQVHLIDQYEGRIFDDYEPAMAYAEKDLGFPTLLSKAMDATAELPDGFVTMGFSNGGVMAQYVAAKRPGVSGVVLVAAGVDPADLKASWPRGVPGQIHYTEKDPWREQPGIDAAVAAARAADAKIEVFDYPGRGHLFADPSKVDEYQPKEAELMWSRVLEFLDSRR